MFWRPAAGLRAALKPGVAWFDIDFSCAILLTLKRDFIMEKIIVYVNDVNHAIQQIAPMRRHAAASALAGGPGTQWILVASAPRMTRHVSKWLTHSARTSWRAKWSERLFSEIALLLKTDQDEVQTLLAKEPLVEMTDALLLQYGPARVLDARLALPGQDLQPITRDQPASSESRWAVPGALVGLGTVMALAAD